MDYKNSAQYKDYENIVNELNTYRANHPMTNTQGNKLRHLAGSAAMAQKYGFLTSNLLGAGKEYDDYFNKHKDGWDSLGDLGNNLFGSIIGQVTPPFVPRSNLYDFIAKNIVGVK